MRGMRSAARCPAFHCSFTSPQSPGCAGAAGVRGSDGYGRRGLYRSGRNRFWCRCRGLHAQQLLQGIGSLWLCGHRHRPRHPWLWRGRGGLTHVQQFLQGVHLLRCGHLLWLPALRHHALLGKPRHQGVVIQSRHALP